MSKQSTRHIVMVRPAAFQYNVQTAETNDYQQRSLTFDKEEVLLKAQEEFDTMVKILRSKGVNIHVVLDSPEPEKPDAIFPNNWFTTHRDGRIFLYPMKTQNRRLERSYEVIQYLKENFKVKSIEDWSYYEKEGQILEGTGSMVFDHEAKLIYACISPRTDKVLLEKLAAEIGYQPIIFNSFKKNGAPQYHTNVVMCVSSHFVTICLGSVPDEKEKAVLKQHIQESGKTLIEISQDQLEQHFAGNMLEVQNESDELLLMMSKNAFDSLTPDQKQVLQKHNELLYADLETIETVGGGSARCMMAEIFLEEK